MAKQKFPEAFGGSMQYPDTFDITKQDTTVNNSNALAGISPMMPTASQMAVEQAPLQSENPSDTTVVNPVTPEAIQASTDTLNQLQESRQVPQPEPIIQREETLPTEDQFLLEQEAQATPQPQQPAIMGPAEQAHVKSYQQQMNANAAIAAAQAKSFKDSAKTYEDANKQLDQLQLDNNKRIQDFKKETDGYKQSLLKLANDIETSKPEFKDYWADKSTGFKIIAALGIAAGTFAESRGGPNIAMKAINDAINRDTEQQKYIYEQGLQNKKTKAALVDNIYSRAMQTFDNEVAASSFTKGIQLEQTKNKLNEIAAKSGQAQAPQQAAILNAELTRQQQQAYQQFNAAMQQKAYLNTLDNSKIMQMSPLEMAQAGLPKEMIDAATKQQERTLAGTNIVMPDKETRAKVEAEIGDTAVAVQGLKDLYAITNPKNWSKYNIENRAMAQQKINELAGTLRQPILGPGIMDQKEYQRLTKDVIGDPTAVMKLESDETSRKKLLALANSLETKMRVKVAPYIKGGKSLINKPVITPTPKK